MKEHVLFDGATASAVSGDAKTKASAGEVQTVVAARRLKNAKSVLIGVGRPSTAAILARMVLNPDLVLVYESGTIGAKPDRIPLSIGDGELAKTADVARLRNPGDVQLLDRAGPD